MRQTLPDGPASHCLSRQSLNSGLLYQFMRLGWVSRLRGPQFFSCSVPLSAACPALTRANPGTRELSKARPGLLGVGASYQLRRRTSTTAGMSDPDKHTQAGGAGAPPVSHEMQTAERDGFAPEPVQVRRFTPGNKLPPQEAQLEPDPELESTDHGSSAPGSPTAFPQELSEATPVGASVSATMSESSHPSASSSQQPPTTKKMKGIKRKVRPAKQPAFDPESTTHAVPSAASGGVPDPAPAYLLRSSAAPGPPLASPRQILVVMDLNGTLLHRPCRRAPKRFIERPYARRFLTYCVETFCVMVWSSAAPQNVASMCAQLLANPEPLPTTRAPSSSTVGARPIAVWARDKFGLSPTDYSQKVMCYKRLSQVWADAAIQACHPEFADGGRWDQTNTVLVDDSFEKARSEPHNILRLPEFDGDAQEKGYVLPQVHEYLNQLCFQKDISCYIRGRPFEPRDDFTLGHD